MEYDALILGGGPAGSTAATLLAERGHRVLLLEKSKFPRYHVGESLMPFCWFTLDRLGLAERMDQIGFQQKKSVQFATPDGRISAPFYFFQHFDHPAATTWQVERKDFDLMLLENARAKGVEVRENTTALDFLKERGRPADSTQENERILGVRARTADEDPFEVTARVTLDCTGRDALFQRKHGWRKRDPQLNKIAIWTLFRGAKRDPGLDEGATTIAYLPGGGWFWNIPLRDGIVSSGIVAERDYLYRDTRDPAEIFVREIENNAWIKEHLAGGESLGEYWIAGEYSYRAKHCATDGLVLAGDAFAFLDPVFSSGVFLALKSGEMAADATHAALEKNDTRATSFAGYGEQLCGHIETMRRIVYAFYDQQFSFAKLIRQHPELRPKLTDLLIGNVDGQDYTDLSQAIAGLAKLPEPLDYGRVAVGA